MVKSMLIVYVFTYSLPGVTLNNKQQSNRLRQWVCRKERKWLYILVSFMTLFSCFFEQEAPHFYFCAWVCSVAGLVDSVHVLKASRFLRQPFLIGVHPHVSWVTLRSGNSWGVWENETDMILLLLWSTWTHHTCSFIPKSLLPLAGLDYFPCVLGVLSGLHYIISYSHACLPPLDHWIALGWWTCVIHPVPSRPWTWLSCGRQPITNIVNYNLFPHALLLTHLHASPAHI